MNVRCVARREGPRRAGHVREVSSGLVRRGSGGEGSVHSAPHSTRFLLSKQTHSDSEPTCGDALLTRVHSTLRLLACNPNTVLTVNSRTIEYMFEWTHKANDQLVITTLENRFCRKGFQISHAFLLLVWIEFWRSDISHIDGKSDWSEIVSTKIQTPLDLANEERYRFVNIRNIMSKHICFE